MSYLVDTHVPSELRRKAPTKAVRGWFAVRPAFFSGRILGIDKAVAERWGRMAAAAATGYRQPAGRHGRPAWSGTGDAQRARLRVPGGASARLVGGELKP